MITTKEVIIDNNQNEKLDGQNEGLLYVCQRNYFDLFYEKKVPWHWHNELEVAYITSGDYVYSFPECKINVHRGDLLFINSNVLHGILPENNDLTGCVMDVIRFDPSLLSGGYNSSISSKYFIPLLGCTSIPFRRFSPEEKSSAEIIYNFQMAFRADEEAKYGFEFDVQYRLSQLWLSILKELEPLIEKSKSHNDASLERLKQMMSFIQENYAEKLTVEDIAQSASISVRECSRCFSSNLSQSPMDYLNNFRTQRACEMLISGSKSVLEISESCGFSTGSYFSKSFGKIMGCTPLEYRKKNRKSIV